MYLRPIDLNDALAALAAAPCSILAGGTDFYAARVGRPLPDAMLDITALDGLRGIEETAAGFRIGALTTWSSLIAHPLPPLFDALKLAAREIGGRQIQNAGTVGGNICNASPAADGVPPLLALDADIELTSADSVRRLPLHAFLIGNRRTARRPHELVTAIHIPKRTTSARSVYIKLGARRYLVISIAMVAACIERAEDGCIAHAAVAVGSCSEVAQRLPSLEAKLCGMRDAADALASIDVTDLTPLKPITDVRAVATYRSDVALTLVRRALEQVL